ncbi:glutathione peroxidase [Marichromatium gracile]|uniref:Glutaredoxin-like protein n=1 Tax=Marichromatium gracile TaxID=1048 RepID=A0A4R4ADD4_MARGR|nr:MULTISPECIES: glutathione peroxidase [Marichromatium]MBK1709202.1 glutathione peroxidase [Marichromatium gracile]MCF1182662.1 glutathione peroxidase [Marichromatium gracile]RNE91436.1 glutathione peroxidase [Marichromatium sp. AB31]RNE92852.1 glutathione peroxidase [Marichromatium sp. AB32]TCW37098.1 glutaredoxin-like protein [Marichromatium gracile]
MLQDRTGSRVPQVTFHTRSGHEWVDLTTDEIFAGKTVVVFSLPGAFTPTCSSSHVPRYNQLVPMFKEHGVDTVACVSVNDTFVMNEWQKTQHADDLLFIPDGNGEFTEGMGMLVEKDDLGFGKRSWRYSMLVRDGVVEKMFIEPEVEGDPYEVSDADTMLAHLAPNAPKPMDVSVFTRDGCPFCVKAKEALRNAGIDFEELVLNEDYTEQTLRAVANARTVPQVFVNGELIGGSEAVEGWLKERASA